MALSVALGAWTGLAAAEVVTLSAAQVASFGVTSVPLTATGQGGLTVPAQLRLPAQQQRVLAAPVAGLVTAIQADSGDAVRQGQALVRMRSTEAQALRSDVLQASAQLELAERSLRRDEALMAEGLIAQSRLDQSRLQARQSRLALQQQQQALGQAVGAAQVSPQGELTLVAPMGGQVAEWMVTVGQRVEAAAPLVKIANLRTLTVEMQVPAQQTQGLQPGQAVQVLLPDVGTPQAAGTGELLAEVVSIAPLLDERTQSVTVRASLRQPATGGLRPGQWVQARLRTSAALPLVPEAAIVTLTASGQQAVFIEEASGRYRLNAVKVVGRQGADMVVQGLPVPANAQAATAPRVVTRGTAALKALLQP